MTLHLQIGPGHHDQILKSQLEKRGLSFSYSRYHPQYEFGVVRRGKIESVHHSALYNLTKWIVWGSSNRLPWLRHRNRHRDITYLMYDRITRSLLPPDVDLVFGWAQVSLQTFRRVKDRGGKTVLDYPIPHILTWQRTLREEMKRTKGSMPYSFFSDVMVGRMLEEIRLSDFISVPSRFVHDSFLEHGVPSSKLIFNSYGIDTDTFKQSESRPGVQNNTLDLIFVGSVEIRKGVHYLLSAMEKITHLPVRLTIVGTVQPDFLPFHRRFSVLPNVRWVGQLDRPSTVEALQKSDVMVMPSLSEGLSLTILEAMSCELPVISTTAAGGLGVIADGIDGFIVEPGNVDLLLERINWCLHQKEKLRSMGSLARIKVLTSYTMDSYAERFVTSILKPNTSNLPL